MIKTLSNIFKQDKEKFIIPRSVQQVIPIETIWSDGIFKIGRNKFARTYKFTDINYAVASKVDKETMFLEYMDLLNSFDCGGTTKITINNRRLNKVDFEKAILIPMQEDGLDLYRKEYNNMLLDKATSSNSMVQEKYVTVSCYKKTIEEAMLIPVFAHKVLEEYNKKQTVKIPNSLEEAGVTVVNINGINFKYFYPLFCDTDWEEDRLPIRCSGITDKDPVADIEKDEKGRIIKKEEKYPIEGENIIGGNKAIELVESINSTKQARLYVASLKTFEYDLAMNGNCSLMAEILYENWPNDGKKENSVKNKCKKIKEKTAYKEDDEMREDAKYIYTHIDCDEIGKGAFSHALLEKIESGQTIIVPQYIKKAIIWACGGDCE